MVGHDKISVLITRAEPAASRTAQKLSNEGFRPVVMPLFEVVDTKADFSDDPYDGYIFTSSNAAKILLERGWVCHDESAVAYCVGDQTAQAAQSLGFSNIRSAQGTAADLGPMLKSEAARKAVRMLYFAGIERAFDMYAALSDSGITLEMAEIYQIEQVFPDQEKINRTLGELGEGIVFLYSPGTAQHVGEVLFKSSDELMQEKLSAITISAKTRDAVLKYPWCQVYVADEPNERSMIAKISEISLA